MKQLVLVFAMLFATVMYSQTSTQPQVGQSSETNLSKADVATQKGTYVLGLNGTGLGVTNVNDVTNVNVGASFGGFVADRFALLFNVGYGTTFYQGSSVNDWAYGAGAKYYLGGVMPLQVDWSGSTGNSVHPSTSFVGTQLGYAWFPFTNFSIEPAVRYDISTKDEYANVFSGRLGFNLFF